MISTVALFAGHKADTLARHQRPRFDVAVNDRAPQRNRPRNARSRVVLLFCDSSPRVNRSTTRRCIAAKQSVAGLCKARTGITRKTRIELDRSDGIALPRRWMTPA